MKKRMTRSEALRFLWKNTIFRKADAKPLSNKQRKRLERAKRQTSLK